MVVSQWSLSEHKAQRSFDSQESRPTAKAGLTASFQSEPSGKPKQAGTPPAAGSGRVPQSKLRTQGQATISLAGEG